MDGVFREERMLEAEGSSSCEWKAVWGLGVDVVYQLVLVARIAILGSANWR